jgi:uncharacterized protein YbbC (DUF1343 family)
MVQTGLERVLTGDSRALAGKRIGLLVNPTAVAQNLDFAVDRLCAMPDWQVSCLFGPEHGVRGDAQDMIGVGEARDSVTGLPMYSLYGSDEASLAPRPEWLAGLDAVVFDMQDIGSRYYTYVWTLLHVMQVAAPLGVEVIVLDRPNPLGGAIEGGRVQDRYRSFVGRVSVPNRHGMTAGEVATFCNATLGLGCKLTVVEMKGWWRSQPFTATGLPWVMTSPNLPTLDTALVYPGMCLIEGTELSEGRGTTRPFELVGAAFVSFAEARALAAGLTAQDLPGVRFRPVVFTPTFHKFGGKRCGGLQLHVTDAGAFDSYATGVAVVREFRLRHPQAFRWRSRPYEFIADVPAFDLLSGGPEVRELIEDGAPLATIRATWAADQAAFAATRAPYLLYPEHAP